MAQPQGMKIHRINGASLIDDVFTITLRSGETVTWNVTKLARAAKAGAFGPPRFLPTVDLPAADWTNWGKEDRAKVEWIKRDPAVLNEPAIAIASDHPGFLASCFADGQHRVTARQELKLPECSFYLVPLSIERSFRVTGMDMLDRLIEEGGKS